MTENSSTQKKSFETFKTVGLAIDPIHVGTGGARLGRVDNTIVRDPVTRIPKIPGSSLAGVHRAYAAMALEDERLSKPSKEQQNERCYYPNDAGQGASGSDGKGPVNAVFGHKSFSGLAGFSDAHVVLFPVATCEGPVWVTSPTALQCLGITLEVAENVVLREGSHPVALNLGWLRLKAVPFPKEFKKEELQNSGISDTILSALVVVSDKLFGHIVNSNLEVRTSVAIDPATGAAEEGALFTYEALPRATVLAWDVTCRNPHHFKRVDELGSTLSSVHDVVKRAHPFLEALGIGGMGTRGMGRLRVISPNQTSETGAAS